MTDGMYMSLTQNERNEIARRHAEAAEHWLRRLTHHKLTAIHGPNYLTQTTLLDARVVAFLRKAEQEREIDGTTFEQVLALLNDERRYSDIFDEALKGAYPSGRNEAMHYLKQIKDVRNAVSHGRNCSVRMLEKAICYSNDLAESIQAYFRKMDLEREFNVPMIVRYADSLGNESYLEDISTDIDMRIIDLRPRVSGELRPGENLVAEVEVDTSFEPGEYDVSWRVSGFQGGQGPVAKLMIQNKHVGEQLEVRFQVISKQEWHRKHGIDDALTVIFKVLPPNNG